MSQAKWRTAMVTALLLAAVSLTAAVVLAAIGVDSYFAGDGIGQPLDGELLSWLGLSAVCLFTFYPAYVLASDKVGL